MIAFRCAHCDRDLKVKDELTGKKVRCPGCGNAVAVPETTAARAAGQMQQGTPRSADEITLPPRAPQGTDERTLPPARQAAHDSLPDSDEQTDLGGKKGEATQTYATDEAHAELTDFLAPAEAADELGRLGGFRILKVLGHGGMGVVFQGEDPKLGRKVAIKAMLPHLAGSKSSQERFLREAKAAAALEHDHIVPILQIGEDRGAPFIVMPFLQGEPLDQRLKHDGSLPIAEVLRIGRETAEGLAAAHKLGLIHRDIKPANLWLEGDKGRVKILDFGLARAGGETGLTQTGAIIGTPQYMAPEQAAGSKNLDQRCDLFSLGCVLYRMCTGQLPFKGDDTLAIISALAMDTPKTPTELHGDVPRSLSNLVMQLLAKKPEDRPESAQAVVEAFQKLDLRSDATQPIRLKPVAVACMGKSENSTAIAKSVPARMRGPTVAIACGVTAALVAVALGIVLLWRMSHGLVKVESNDPTGEIPFDKGAKIKEAGTEPIAAGIASAGENTVQIKVAKNHIDFSAAGELVTRYQIGPKFPRPIFWPLMAPGGVKVTRSWPMVEKTPAESDDHIHQKSAWFCHGDVIPEGIELKHKLRNVDGVDFWSENKERGQIVTTKVGSPKTKGSTGSVVLQNEWQTVDGVKIMDETRKITLHDLGKARLIVLDFDLLASVCPITFGDTKEGALGVRVNDQIRGDKKGKGKMTNAEGKIHEHGCWGHISAWCDFSGPIDGNLAGIALLADPKNPYPTCWHARNYGLMAANPFGRKKALFPATKGRTDLVRLAKGEHLRMRYGILVHTGDCETANVAEIYQRFVKLREEN